MTTTDQEQKLLEQLVRLYRWVLDTHGVHNDVEIRRVGQNIEVCLNRIEVSEAASYIIPAMSLEFWLDNRERLAFEPTHQVIRREPGTFVFSLGVLLQQKVISGVSFYVTREGHRKYVSDEYLVEYRPASTLSDAIFAYTQREGFSARRLSLGWAVRIGEHGEETCGSTMREAILRAIDNEEADEEPLE